MVAEAKKTEMDFINKFGVYKKVPLSECLEATGRQPIGCTWAVTNKGDETNPNIRARLCAQEVKRADPHREDVFAATPPLEGLKLIASLGMTLEPSRGKNKAA